MQNDFFRILSLSGGGARGILQAELLCLYEREIGAPVRSQFDLIVGTSVGGVIAVALAHGVPTERISKIFRDSMGAVFVSQNAWGVYRRPTYSFAPLQEKLLREFGNARIAGLTRKVVLISATLDRFQIKLITNVTGLAGSETDISLVDAALATAAAPTYFSAVRPEGKEQSYVDGGVWANSPSLVGYFTAIRKLHVPEQRIKLVHIGTGTMPTGILRSDYDDLRPIGISTIKTILELIFACQVDGSEYQLREAIGSDRYFSVNPQLQNSIALDNAIAAVRELPALAETTFQDCSHRLQAFLPKRDKDYALGAAKLADYEMISASGLRTFVPHRRYYARFRSGAESITNYIRRAEHSVTFVSINLLTGTQLEDIRQVIEAKLLINPKFIATISLLCPRKQDLMDSTAPILKLNGEQLAKGITETLDTLKLWKSEMAVRDRPRFKIRTHNALPFGSAIIIDQDHPTGTIQIETKAYKRPLEESFAFEVGDGSESGLYGSLLEGFRILLEEGTEEN